MTSRLAYQPANTSGPDVTKKCQHFAPLGGDYRNNTLTGDTNRKCSQGGSSLAAAALDVLEMGAAGSVPADKTHNDVLRSNTGWEIDPVRWAKRAKASRRLTSQNERIAAALTRAGVDVQRDGDVTMIGAVTGIVESSPIYRAVRFLPTVAARDRRPMLNGLKLFMAEHKNSEDFRYAVITAPAPVPAFGDLRETIEHLSRRISKWANWIKEEWDIKVLFRGIEYTRATAAERGMADRYPADTILYHVHANVIYWPTHKLEEKQWEDFLKGTHKRVSAEWKDNGRVRKLEEIVKYCSKPSDTLAASDDELVWQYNQTSRLKIAQPMGDFLLWMRGLKQRREKVVRVNDGVDGRLMRVRKYSRKSEVDECHTDQVSAAAEQTEVADVDPSSGPAVVDVISSSTTPANVVLGMSLPQWRYTPWAEPMILVQNYDASRLGEGDQIDIEIWRDEARGWWDAAGAPHPEEALFVAELALAADNEEEEEDVYDAAEAARYIVHTCRPTVHEDHKSDHENSCESRIEKPEPDDFLTVAVTKLRMEREITDRLVKTVLDDIAAQCLKRRISPALPSVADVQMAIWREKRGKDRHSELRAAEVQADYDEFLAWVDELTRPKVAA